MAIAIDNSTTGENTSGTSTSFSYTTSGSDRLLLVNTMQRGGSGFNVTGITYNGVPMIQVGSTQSQESGQSKQNFWYLLNPALGSNTMVITSNGTQNPMDYSIASYTGVKQTGFPDASTQNGSTTGSSFTGTVSTVAANCWTVMGISGLQRPWSISSGIGTIRTQNASYLSAIADSSGAIVSPGSTSLNIGQNASGFYMYSMVSFAPALTSNIKTRNGIAWADIKSINGQT